MNNFTINDFLGGLVRLKQPAEGYRATSDSVMVAAAVPLKAGDSVLDVGTGTGVIPLCLNARVSGCRFVGVECQSELVSLAKENALLNQCDLSVFEMDITHRPSLIHGQQFHQVVTNPPFYTEPFSREHKQTDIAYRQRIELNDWLSFCLIHLRAKGTLTLIHRTEALPDILEVLKGRVGGLEIFPIVSKLNGQAKRIVVRGIMNSKKPLILHSPIVMHLQDNTRTETAEQIFRAGQGLDALLKD